MKMIDTLQRDNEDPFCCWESRKRRYRAYDSQSSLHADGSIPAHGSLSLNINSTNVVSAKAC